MAATQKMPVTAPPDAFEVYNELVRRGRRSWLVNVASLLVTASALGLAFMSFTRPLPVVVTSDDPAEPRRIVAAADGVTREIDAKRFFARTAKLASKKARSPPTSHSLTRSGLMFALPSVLSETTPSRPA